MSKKDYEARIYTGMTYVPVEVFDIHLPSLDLNRELMKRQADKLVRDNLDQSITATLGIPEEDRALTAEKIREAFEQIRAIERKKPVADELRCLRPMALEEIYPEDFRRQDRGYDKLPAYSFCGIPVFASHVMPDNVVAFFLEGELIGFDKIKKDPEHEEN